MIIFNINCKQYDKYGFCNKKPRKLFIFKQECVEITEFGKYCEIAERYTSNPPTSRPPMKP